MDDNIELQSLKKIAKGAGFVFIGLLISKALMYGYRLIVARMGTEQYGLLSLGLAIIGIATSLSLIGLKSGIIRYVSFYRGKEDKARIKGVITSSLKISFPLSLFFGFLMFIFSDWISINLFHNVGLIPILKMFSVVVPFYVLGVIFLAVMRAFQRIEYDVFTKEIFENVVKVVLTAILIYIGYGLFGAIMAYVLSIICTFILSFYFLEKKVFPIFRTKIKSISLNRELLSFSWPLMFTSILFMITAWTDTLMIGYFRTTSEVGIYNVALPTAILLTVTPLALCSLFIPIMAELLAKKENKKLKQVYKITTRWIFFINFPIFLLMICFSKQILSILFGQVYSTGALALSILAFGYLIYSTFSTATHFLSTIKKTRLILINSSVTTLSNVLLNLYLIPIYGIIGAALATGASLMLFGLLGSVGLYYFVKIQPVTKDYLKPLVLGSISIVIIYKITKMLFTPVSFYVLVCMGLLFLIIYFVLLLLFRGFGKYDLEILKIIKKRLSF